MLFNFTAKTAYGQFFCHYLTLFDTIPSNRMDPQQTPTAGTPIYQESQEKNAKWLWLLIVLIIVGSLVFAFVRGIGPFSRFSPFTKSEKSSPAPISSPINFTSPSPEATSEARKLDKSEAAVRVLNGGGKAGVASAVKDFLESKGWKVTAVGNADSYDFTQTILKFKEGFSKFKEALVSDLSDDYSVKVSSDKLEATDSADIEIIVGSK